MRREKVLFLRLFVLVVTVKTSVGVDKHWLPDLEWQTGSNWDDGLLPNADSRVIFPEQTWHTVGLPNTGKVEVAEIVLPREGGLSLGKNGILTFSDTRKKKKSVTWTKKGLYLWIDPENWDGYVNATPHIDRIPCERDIVVLPSKDRIVNLALPNIELHVRGVKIADENSVLDKSEWYQIADEPRDFHKNRMSVTYTAGLPQPLCNDCTCHGSSDEELSEEICSFMWQAGRCGGPSCEYPLKVQGHCCDYCGGRVGLSGTASLWKVERRANEALENYRGVISWYVRRTWDSKTEILIAENGEYEGINSQLAVDTLVRTLAADGYEILENVATGSALTGNSVLISVIPMLGIPVILILLILVAIPFSGYSYSQVFSGWREAFTAIEADARPKSKPTSGGTFGFARFQNLPEGDVSLDEGVEAMAKEIMEDDDDPNGPSSSSKRFENPLYKSTREDKKSKTTGKPVAEEKIIDIDRPMSLAALESKVQEAGIEEVCLD